MRLRHGLVVSLFALSACGTLGNSAGSFGGGSSGSSFGGSLFGKKQEQTAEVVTPRDTRAFIPAIKSVATEDAKAGTILRVTGETDRLGYSGLELVLSDQSTSTTLVYELRADAPKFWQEAKTARSKIVQAAIFIPDSLLPAATRIQVIGAQNSKTIRR